MRSRYLPVVAVVAALIGGMYAAGVPAGGEDSGKPYKVVGGNKVDAKTLKGFRTWRAAACERCHGANQQGMVGPSLIEALRRLSKDEFKQVVLEGRLDKGMPAHKNMKTVVEGIDGLYAYLKGRSDGAIKPGRLQSIGDDSARAENR